MVIFKRNTIRRILIVAIYLFASALQTLDSFQPNKVADNTRNNRTMMRAWQCSGRSQRELVDHLLRAGIVTNLMVARVLKQVDRKHYVPSSSSTGTNKSVDADDDVDAYRDAPQPIGRGQTISAPHMHAYSLEQLMPALQANKSTVEPLKVLDVGCGSGYLTACFGRLLQKSNPLLSKHGFVFGIDISPELVEASQRNIQQSDGDLLRDGTVQFQVQNGWAGLPCEAPFDAIHVGAAAAHLPKQLCNQLAVGGVMIVPIGPKGGVQTLVKVERISNADIAGSDDKEYQPASFSNSDYRIQELFDVQYVPLIDSL